MLGLTVGGWATPWWFLLGVAALALLAGYLLVQRNQRRRAARFARPELADRVAPRRQGRIRHLPAALLLVALALLTVGLAGPTAEQKVPRNRATVVLVMDVSLSMSATDIQPSRLQAAQTAAKAFADELTNGVNLGLISFSGTATVLVSPTTDRPAIKEGIDSLKLAESSATGDAIEAAVSTIDSFGRLIGGADGPPPARIVLMTDGKENTGTHKALDAAADAKKAGIPISAISYGTAQGVATVHDQQVPVPVNDDEMKQIANASGGQFFKAASADELKSVYDNLSTQMGYETKQADASKPWLMLGTLIGLAAVVVSLVLTQRLP